MQKPHTNSWVRMALAFAAVLLVGGAGMALAIGPNPDYPPTSSILIGPSSLKPGQTANYIFEVTFGGGGRADFPPTTSATFSAALGSITYRGVYTAPASGPRDRVSGTFGQDGATTTASRIIAIQ